MNILFVGHDLAYVRFYQAIESALAQHVKFTSRHLYFRPSAWFYARFALGLPAISPSLTRLIGRWPVDARADTDSLDLRFYPGATDGQVRARFGRLYQAYCRFLRKSLGGSRFDVAILPGEFRLFEQATIAVLQSSGQCPQIIYFEAGPPGYVYLDESGVNANASFSATGVSHLLRHLGISAAQRVGTGTVLPSAVRTALLAADVAWLGLAKISRGLLDLEELWVATGNRLKKRSASRGHTGTASTDTPPPNCVIFVGQVRNDINHTHFGVTDSQLEKHLSALLSKDPTLNLVWRDHPLENSDEVFNRICAAFPGRVQRMGQMPLQQALRFAEGVVTVNSNGGLEALAAGLPVRLLGRSYFANLKGVCGDDASFQACREKIREDGPDETIRADAERFLQDCFLPIDYRGEDFSNAYLAAQVILSCKI